MNSLETLTAFFGWFAVINIGLLTLGMIKLVAMRRPISQIHARMFGVSEEDLSRAYFQYLAQYKTAVIVLALVPYIALKMVA
jgi:hypothetical protein